VTLVLVAVSAGAGCDGRDARDDGDLTPPPPSISAGDVTIETDPLRLVVAAPGGEFAVERFIEVGVVDAIDPTRYYDPRDLGADGVTWLVAERAVGIDDATGRLALDTGVTIALAVGRIDGAATLTVDAAAVAGAVLLRVAAPRDDGEAVFGFGENFESAVAGGDVREMQLRVDTESETGINEAHAPVPLSLWPRRGVGLFVEDPRPAAFDVGAARPDRVLATFTLAAPGPLAAHLFTRAEPLDLSRAYAELTALPAVPPLWAFAPQQWRNEHESSDEVRADARAMRELGIPGSVMWIDNPWQTGYNTFEFDETRFAGSAALIEELGALGYHVIVWSTPHLLIAAPTDDDHDEAADAGYLVTDDIGRPFAFPWKGGPVGVIDFTADGATAWWRDRIARVTALGVVGFKLDYGEEVVPALGTTLAPIRLAGGTAQTLRGAYARGYHDAYLGALPDGDGFLITRAGAYGEQAVNTCIWPGDLDNDMSRGGAINEDGSVNVGGLPAAIAGGLSLSVSGYPFYGSDIGGYRGGEPTPETLVRWAQYAALGTIMQLGGGGDSHNPWDEALYGPDAAEIYRRYARLHMDLLPYIYTLAIAAGADGAPVTRPTRFVHPTAASDADTFLLGDALFVAPVVEAGATTRVVVLPPGQWIDWWTGELAIGDGAAAITVEAPLDRLPLWRRADALVPMFARAADTLLPATADGVTSYAERAYGRELRLLVTPVIDEASTSVYDGFTATAGPDDGGYAVTATAGDQFDIVTVDVDSRASAGMFSAAPSQVTVDGSALAAVSADAVADCMAPGCWSWDEAARRLQARVFLGDGARTIRVE
jgi:alpha-D-xyloside xylohydrolase